MPATTTKKMKAAEKAAHPSGDNRFQMIDRTLKRFRYEQDALIEVLHTAQEVFGYLDHDLLVYVARQLKLAPSWVYGVATFYHFFSLEPKGEHTCNVCMGTACYVKGAGEIVSLIEKEFGIKTGETTPDGKFTLTEARCLGSCGLAPVLILDGEVIGRETPQQILERVKTAVYSEDKNGSNGKVNAETVQEAATL